MATRNQAQDVVRCMYCQQYAPYHCKTCGVEMCKTCKDSHKKDQNFSNHVIVSYFERETARVRCRYHHTRFYTQGCKKCGIPICPECKMSHLQHKVTDIITVCKNADLKIQNGLTDMQNKNRDVDNYLTKGVGYTRYHNFKQVKKNLQDRATELKICIDNFLSRSIEIVEQKECYYQRSVENYIGELSNTLTEKRKACENSLEKLKLIDLPFYVKENPDWNYVNERHDIQGLQIVRFESNDFDKSEIERLFGTLSFEDTTVGKIFENTQTKRPQTAVSMLRLRTKFQTRHKEVSKTERKINRRPSFHSIDNKYRHAIGLLEVPFLLKEFKSSVKFLYHIAYDKQLSRLCISGHSPKIHVYKYSYNNVFGICNIDSKYEILIVEDEPQGLAIGYKNRLVYSDSQNGVIEMRQNITHEKGNEMPIKSGRNARILFKREGYNFWGIHYTSSGKYLVCIIPYASNPEHPNASVIKISNDGRLENEYTNNEEGEPLFCKPLNICENRLNQNICVSDMVCKVVVLTSSGNVRFSYLGVQPTVSRLPFNPRGIACDKQGNILVADLDSHVIHLLRGDGVFVTHVLSSTSPISQPWGICVDSQNKVWVVERNMSGGEVQSYAKVKVFQIYKT